MYVSLYANAFLLTIFNIRNIELLFDCLHWFKNSILTPIRAFYHNLDVSHIKTFFIVLDKKGYLVNKFLKNICCGYSLEVPC